MYTAVFNFLRGLKANTEDESNGRHVVPPLIIEACSGQSTPRILDVGAGYGRDLFAVQAAIPEAHLFAVEGYPPAVEHLGERGVSVVSINLERDRLPFEDNSFDVVMCNQVIEHIKEIFWLVGEMSRVCRRDGHIMIGTPNLGSLHNRVALFFGHQPPAIHVFGPHVRGYTVHGLSEFLQEGGLLKVEKAVGSGFYPFKPRISRRLAKVAPGLAVSTFVLSRKVGDQSFLDCLDGPRRQELVDTPYYRGAE